MHELGARKFVVIGVGPIGCIPYLRVIKLVKKGDCLSAANTLIQGYNMKLIRAINKLNEDLGPESVFVYANTYDIFLDMIQSYHKYGKCFTLQLSSTHYFHTHKKKEEKISGID